MAKVKIDSADLKRGIATNAEAQGKTAQDFADYKQAQTEKAAADALVIAELKTRLEKAEAANEDYKARIADLEELTTEDVVEGV